MTADEFVTVHCNAGGHVYEEAAEKVERMLRSDRPNTPFSKDDGVVEIHHSSCKFCSAARDAKRYDFDGELIDY